MKNTFRQKLTPLIVLWWYMSISIVICDVDKLTGKPSDLGSLQDLKTVNNRNVSEKSGDQGGVNSPRGIPKSDKTTLNTAENSTKQDANANNVTPKSNPSNETTSPAPTKVTFGSISPPALNTGALRRGFYVFIGLSVIVIAYITFRSTKLSNNRTQMVRKYGILAHRQDVEMRPLPLEDEDEDDTTVFDASNVTSQSVRSEQT